MTDVLSHATTMSEYLGLLVRLRGMDERQLARAAGVSPHTAQLWLWGAANPAPTPLRRLCTRLDLDLDHLMALAGYTAESERSPAGGEQEDTGHVMARVGYTGRTAGSSAPAGDPAPVEPDLRAALTEMVHEMGELTARWHARLREFEARAAG